MMRLALGSRLVGAGAPCLVIAEAGVNHNGDVVLAHRLVDAAADAGADAVKFQTFEPALLAAPVAATAVYQRDTGRGTQVEMLAALTLPEEALAALQGHARQRGIECLSTPFDAGSVERLDRLGVPAFKVSSGDLTNHLLLRAIARKRRPILLSTGMATLDEVQRALGAIREVATVPVCLLHCVSSYPAPAWAANLRAMRTLADRFDLPVGFSDHTLGTTIALGAVALGAVVLEKHLTLDIGLPGPDHKASLAPDEFRRLVSAVRELESAMGDGVKRATEPEQEALMLGRRSLYWGRALPEGAVVEESHLLPLRPAHGLAPDVWQTLVGRRLTRDVSAGDAVLPGDVR